MADDPREEGAADRRAHHRVPYDAMVRLVIGDAPPLHCESLDLSAGGMLLRIQGAGTAPALHELLEVCLMQREDRVMTLDADVVRHVDDRTFGVRFLDLDNYRRTFLARLVNVVSVVHTGAYGAAATVDVDLDFDDEVDDDEAAGDSMPPTEQRPTLGAVPPPPAPPPPATLDEIGAPDDVPRIVSADSVDWHTLDYRMVYLLSLITPGTLSFAEVIDQAAMLADLEPEQTTAFLAELTRLGIIQTPDEDR